MTKNIDEISVPSVAFQPRVFREFVALIGRLFYDDGCIVLLDFLAREQKAMAEAELRERLRWREPLLLSKLHILERQLLIEQFTETNDKGYKAVQLWRIQCNCFVAIEWRLRALEDLLREEVRKVARQSDFKCSNCANRVSLLDAASGPRALEDDHPLCRHCGHPLTTADSEEARIVSEDKLRRGKEQMLPLTEALNRVKGMVVPLFTSQTELESEEPSATASQTSKSETSNKSLGKQTIIEKSLLAETTVTPPTIDNQPTRNIPWFQQTNASTNKQLESAQQRNSFPALPMKMAFGTAAQTPGTLPLPFKPSTLPLDPPSHQPPSVTTGFTPDRSPLKMNFGTGSAVGGGSGVGTTAKKFSLSLKNITTEYDADHVFCFIFRSPKTTTPASEPGSSKRKPSGQDVFISLAKRVKL